ncbi:MAG: trypsin-like serine protease, partial [Planctomycetota bacterium]
LAVTDGIISRIEYKAYFNSEAGLRIQVDAAINPGNSGGPAVIDGELVGLVFSKISQADNIGYLIPTDEIQMFLEDVKDGKYDGKPNLYDTLQSTENSALRAKLKMKSDRTGIMVKDPYEEESPLRAWDVITHIGDHQVDNKGHVVVRDDLRLFFKHFIPNEAKDGKVALKVWRDGEEVAVEVPVHKVRDSILPELNGTYPRHFIYGPVVFTVATKDLVRNLGTKGLGFLSAMESPLVYRSGAKPEFADEELVIFRLLPHLTTKGYSTVPFGVIDKVNDAEIKNLRHLVQVLRDNKEEFITYTIAGNYETMVFKKSDMDEATEEILSDEGIRYQFSKDLEAVWEGEEDAEVKVTEATSPASESDAEADESATETPAEEGDEPTGEVPKEEAEPAGASG